MGERQEEKSQKAILLDDLGSQNLPTTGLPELATHKLAREPESQVTLESPQKVRKET